MTESESDQELKVRSLMLEICRHLHQKGCTLGDVFEVAGALSMAVALSASGNNRERAVDIILNLMSRIIRTLIDPKKEVREVSCCEEGEKGEEKRG